MATKYIIHVVLISITDGETDHEKNDIIEEEEVDGCKLEYDDYDEARRDFDKVKYKP